MADICHNQSVHNRHAETSVDLIRRENLATTSVAGLKRPLETTNAQNECENALPEIRTAFKTARLFTAPRRCLRASSIAPVSLPQNHQDDENNTIPISSQLHHHPSTPGPTQNPLSSLRHARYAIPEQLISNLESLGVYAIYPWQSSCLLGKGILAGETNLVYTAPTGGGKSLVAEVLLLKRIIENPDKKAILVLPYVALVQEKVKWLRRVVEGLVKHNETWMGGEADHGTQPSRRSRSSPIRLAGFFGGSRARSTWADIDIAVCTIEKVGVSSSASRSRCLADDALGLGKFSHQCWN
jgi:hypothetical protein